MIRKGVHARWRQVSLRSLILAILFAALVLAFVVLPAHSQFRSRRWVESQRGRVDLTPNYREQGGWYVASGYCPLPKLIVNVVGIDMFASVKNVVLDCEEVHDLSGLKGFTRMESLFVNQFVHNANAFDALRGLPRLKTLVLSKWSGLSTDEVRVISNSLSGVHVIAE